MSNRMWGGRFASGPAEIMEEINASIGFDKRLAPQDIRGSLAHVAMLGRQGILPSGDVAAIEAGLKAVGAEIEGGTFAYRRELEDIHMSVESRLTEIV
ncbi:MAG TPA: argininosuccinate lyase, partial [Methylobacterium sp.]